jgi:multiple sugar transport system substrate-binding protein
MQFFAAKGLATPIDDVWKALTPQMPPAVKAASTGLDGHQYLVPNKNYPWAVYYRKSLWK